MQTFLPYRNFEESAYVLDTRRLGKQRVENLQIMQSLFGVKMNTSDTIFTGEYKTIWVDSDGNQVDETEKTPGGDIRSIIEPCMRRVELPKESWFIEKVEKPAWRNHPAVKMWEGHEWSLLLYQKACCEDWMENLGFEDTCFEKTLFLYFMCYDGRDDNNDPPWLGDEAFHLSHQSNLVRKDPEFYRKFFPGVPDDLPYIWPKP